MIGYFSYLFFSACIFCSPFFCTAKLNILCVFIQAAKILANLIVMGGGILARAFVQAYRQALASKSVVEISPSEGIKCLFEAMNYLQKSELCF